MKQEIIIKIAIGFMLIVVFYLLLKKIGLITTKTKEDKEAEKIAGETKVKVSVQLAKQFNNVIDFKNSNLWDVNLWKKQSTSTMLTSASAKLIAKNIKNAFGFLNDNEEQIYAAFRTMKNKYNVSQVSDAYRILFNEDLAGSLVEKLNDYELSNIWDIVNSKP